MQVFHLSHKEILEMSFLEMLRIIQEKNEEEEEKDKEYDKAKSDPPKEEGGNNIMNMQGQPGFKIKIH